MRKVIFSLFIVLLIFWAIKRNQDNKIQEFVSPLADSFNINILLPKPQKNQKTLLEEIKKITQEIGGTWSVFVLDLKSNKSFGLNETTIFTAASVNKVPILAALYYLADKGKIDLDKQITIQKKDIQDYGTGILRYEGEGKTYSLKTLARLMMEKSDNTAAYILGRQVIGFEEIQKLVDQWGLKQTNMEENKTSLLDISLLFKKIYQKEITSPSLTLEMIGFMDDSDFENRIPAFLPKDVKVYHKTGDEIGNIHDVGIVDFKNNPYFIGVMSADITNEEHAYETIAKISKIVFDFMEK